MWLEKWAIQAWYWITYFCFIGVIYFWLLLFWSYMKLCVCPELYVCAMSCSLPSVYWGTILEVSDLIIVIGHRTCIFCATFLLCISFLQFFFTYNDLRNTCRVTNEKPLHTLSHCKQLINRSCYPFERMMVNTQL